MDTIRTGTLAGFLDLRLGPRQSILGRVSDDRFLGGAITTLRERAVRSLERTFAGRCLYRFIELEGGDRAIALSSRAFIAVIPLAVVATAFTPADASLADRLVERFQLEGAAAATIRQLFTTPSEVRGAATVVGLVALLVTCHSFARLLQRTYERIWRLEPLGVRGAFRGLVWIAGLAAFLAFVVPIRNWVQHIGGAPFYIVVTVVTSTALWAWTPYVLLAGRVHWHRLVPSALLVAVGLAVLTAASVIYMPSTIERSAESYGLIGVTFAFVTWLFVSALVIIVAGVIGAEASDQPPRLRSVKP
jgi:membrane protein